MLGPFPRAGYNLISATKNDIYGYFARQIFARFLTKTIYLFNKFKTGSLESLINAVNLSSKEAIPKLSSLSSLGTHLSRRGVAKSRRKRQHPLG